MYRLVRNSIQKSSGFTLLETLMAMIIMASALLLLANSWSASNSRVKKTQLNFELATLLERKMNELEREYKGKPISEIPDSKEEDFGEEMKNYSWKMTSRKFEFPDISSSLTARDGGADQMTTMIIKKMSEHISKSIKEVTVTIYYKGSKKTLEVNATTYFVDFDRPIAI